MNYWIKAIIEECKKEYKLDLPMEIRLKEENDRLRQRQLLREDEIKDLRFGVVHNLFSQGSSEQDQADDNSIVKG